MHLVAGLYRPYSINVVGVLYSLATSLLQASVATQQLGIRLDPALQAKHGMCALNGHHLCVVKLLQFLRRLSTFACSTPHKTGRRHEISACDVFLTGRQEMATKLRVLGSLPTASRLGC